MDANIMKNMISQQHNKSNLSGRKITKSSKSRRNSSNKSKSDAKELTSKGTSRNVASSTSSDSEVSYNDRYITIKKRIPKSTVMPWTLTLSVDSIAKLNALKKIYHFRNRDQAFKLLSNHSMKELVSKKGYKGRKLFNLFKEAYKVSAEPKAVKRYKRAHK